MEANERDALARAMRLLSRRSYSELELRRKLLQAECSEADALGAIAECRKRGYLNDSLLAEDFAHSLSERGSGGRLIKQKLARRGLPREEIEAALEKVAEAEPDALQHAIEVKLRGLSREKDPRKKREKLLRFLLNRGFSMGAIIAALPSSYDEE